MNDAKQPVTQIRFTLRTIFVIATLAALVLALVRRLPVVLFFLGFVALVVVVNIMFNMMGLYPKE